MSAVASVRRAPTLTQDRFQVAEYQRTVYQVVPKMEHTFEDVLSPEYWTHVAHLLKVGDHIEVFPDRQEYWAHLVVIDVAHLSVRVHCIVKSDIQENALVPTTAPDQFEVSWKGPAHKWCVVRKSDGKYIKSKLPSKDAGNKEIDSYLKALAR